MQLLAKIPAPRFDQSLEAALQDVERAFGIRLTIHDLKGRLRHPDGQPLLPGRNVHQHPCCRRMRYKEPGWNRRCYDDCFKQTEHTANTLQKPFVKRCWKGMAELLVPVFLRNQHLLSILAGVFRHPDGIPPETTLPDWFHREYAKLPLLDSAKLETLVSILQLIGRGILLGEENEQDRGGPTDRKAQIHQFFEDYAHKDVGVPDLARQLGVSPSRARHLVKELTNRNFKALLEEERMLRAGALLQAHNHPLKVVAETVGY
ncbi:PocR ligand-binding domain-containing protein, partial [Pontiella sp.]|uniref:PocR ligand-binding domain-containing protein n=1 Tax=Pontiella sp. TaxID=2837462 RepID=UPI00356A150B